MLPGFDLLGAPLRFSLRPYVSAGKEQPSYFMMRIGPLEVLRSISGPPLPMEPSM